MISCTWLKEVEVGGFRKVLSIGFIWLLTFQTSQSAQAEVWGLSAPSPPAVETPLPARAGAPPSLGELEKGSSIEIAAWAEQLTLDQNAIKARIEALKQESKSRETPSRPPPRRRRNRSSRKRKSWRN